MKSRIPSVMAVVCIACAAGFAMNACTSSHAEADPAPTVSKKQAGYYRMALGAVEVVALSDGTVALGTALLHGDMQAIAASLARAFESNPVNASVNAYLIKTGDRIVLVDTGSGELYGPTLGKTAAVLQDLGVSPLQVTDVLLTHLHPDHIGGLSVGSNRQYPNARVHVNRNEVDFWLNASNKPLVPDNAKPLFDQAAAQFAPYLAANQLDIFDGTADILPGIRALPAPGHSPGHTMYELTSKGEVLTFWGDVFAIQSVQLAHPEVTSDFDSDTAQAASQRALLLADAAARGALLAPAHANFPGFGRLRKTDDGVGYQWYPVTYVNDAAAPVQK